MSVTPQPPAVPTICPACQHSWQAHDADQSTHFVCPECRSYFVDEWEAPKEVIREFRNQPRLERLMRVGTAGTLRSRRYTVAGIIVKAEASEPETEWTEYVLYNSGKGNIVLVEFDGAWQQVAPLPVAPVIQGSGEQAVITFENRNYEFYHSYSAVVRNADGEFDWDITGDEALLVTEYGSDDHRLSFEREPGGTGTWYRSSPVTENMIAEGFRLPSYGMAGYKRLGYQSPNPYEPQLKRLYQIAIGAVIVAGLLQFGINYLHPSSQLLQSQYFVNTRADSSSSEKPVASETFNVPSTTALSVEMSAPLDNSWLEVGAVLVDDKTGRVFESVKSLEQYHGYEDGESWTENSSDKEIIFSAVPKGSYHLNITASGDPGSSVTGIPMNVRVSHKNWVVSNFVLLLIVIVAFPVITRMVSNNFEKNH